MAGYLSYTAKKMPSLSWLVKISTRVSLFHGELKTQK